MTSPSKEMSKKPPKVVALLQELATLKRLKGWTAEDLRLKLNAHLSKKILDSRTGRSQIHRWLDTEGAGWVEPRGEVVLAVGEILTAEKTLVDEKS